MITRTFLPRYISREFVAIRVRDYSNGGFKLTAMDYNSIVRELMDRVAWFKKSDYGYYKSYALSLDGEEAEKIASLILKMASKYFGLCVNFDHIADNFLISGWDMEDIEEYLQGNAEFFCKLGLTRRKVS